MQILEKFYQKFNPNKEIPYYFKYSLGTIVAKPIRKFLNVVIIPNVPFNNIRIMLYKLIGFRIGKNVFIGMKCYLDDMCYDLITIEDNVCISYGVFFACHGKGQGHNKITIKKDAYIGMRVSIINPNESELVIGEKVIVGASSLVNKSIPENNTVVGIPARIV